MQNIAQQAPMVRSTSAHSPTHVTNVSSLQSQVKDTRMVQAKQARAKSSLISRNVTIAGHRTSVRLEPEMWNGLAEICRRECASVHEICTAVNGHKPEGSSLTAAVRVFVMAYFRAASTEDGHNRSGHGPGGQMMLSMLQKATGLSKK